MNSKELRIGNWVYSDEIGKPVQIELISIDNWVSFGSITFDQPTIDEIKPIPLTEEWLLKLGFFKSSVFKGYDIRSGSLIINLERNGDEFLVIFLNIVGRENLKSIKYVHQLQNLYFALTGEELKINNK